MRLGKYKKLVGWFFGIILFWTLVLQGLGYNPYPINIAILSVISIIIIGGPVLVWRSLRKTQEQRGGRNPNKQSRYTFLLSTGFFVTLIAWIVAIVLWFLVVAQSCAHVSGGMKLACFIEGGMLLLLPFLPIFGVLVVVTGLLVYFQKKKDDS